MLQYINENDYNSLMGTSVPSNFQNLTIQASNIINYKTRGRITNISEQVKYVTCLVVNLLNDKDTKIGEIGNLKSQNIEGWSETYQTPKEVEADFDSKIDSLLSQYLWNELGDDGLPLLSKGVLLYE